MGRETAFTATSSSLCSRTPPLLVSFNALMLSIAGQEGQSGKISPLAARPPMVQFVHRCRLPTAPLTEYCWCNFSSVSLAIFFPVIQGVLVRQEISSHLHGDWTTGANPGFRQEGSDPVEN